jgi:hypothetical protein
MKTVNLSINGRVAALSLLNAFKGGFLATGYAMEDIKKLPITEEEWAEAGKTEEQLEGGSKRLHWDNSKAMKDVEFNDTTVEYIVDQLKAKDTKGEFGLADAGMLELCKTFL